MRVADGAGGTQVHVCGVSAIHVERFEVFATRSPAASRTARSMGLPIAAIAPGVDAGWTPTIPAEAGLSRYDATLTHGLVPSWDDWLVRAVAVPVAAVGQHGIRGKRSADSPVVRIALRPTEPPVLSPVVGRSVRTDTVAFETVTDALARTTPAGEFRIGVHVESDGTEQRAATVPLGSVVEVDDPSARPAVVPTSSQAPLVVHGPRTAAGVPLAVWWGRPAPDEPVTCTITITDPVGRTTRGSGRRRLSPSIPRSRCGSWARPRSRRRVSVSASGPRRRGRPTGRCRSSSCRNRSGWVSDRDG